uniref:Uncharacterized protein n=1 Tax=Astyanax mexicanus TaxID=7994 RepID=A0A8B9GQ39_ASTMX
TSLKTISKLRDSLKLRKRGKYYKNISKLIKFSTFTQILYKWRKFKTIITLPTRRVAVSEVLWHKVTSKQLKAFLTLAFTHVRKS